MQKPRGLQPSSIHCSLPTAAGARAGPVQSLDLPVGFPMWVQGAQALGQIHQGVGLECGSMAYQAEV